jgi:hypothetical protein
MAFWDLRNFQQIIPYVIKYVFQEDHGHFPIVNLNRGGIWELEIIDRYRVLGACNSSLRSRYPLVCGRLEWETELPLCCH